MCSLTTEKLKWKSTTIRYLLRNQNLGPLAYTQESVCRKADLLTPGCDEAKCSMYCMVPYKEPWRRTWQPTPVFLPGESPWTEEPGGLQSMGSQSCTRLKQPN